MSEIVVTGFDAFGGLTRNPSEALINGLRSGPHGQIQRIVLPTSYKRSSRLIEAIFAADPLAVLMFGFTDRTDRIRIESVALNGDRKLSADNDGEKGQSVILSDAPTEYSSTVDLLRLFELLHTSHIGFSDSFDAGGYVCNHAYFVALHLARSAMRPVPCLFVHIPDFDTDDTESEVQLGAQLVLDAVADQARAS